jgi:hypothetical protein
MSVSHDPGFHSTLPIVMPAPADDTVTPLRIIQIISRDADPVNAVWLTITRCVTTALEARIEGRGSLVDVPISVRWGAVQSPWQPDPCPVVDYARIAPRIVSVNDQELDYRPFPLRGEEDEGYLEVRVDYKPGEEDRGAD